MVVILCSKFLFGVEDIIIMTLRLHAEGSGHQILRGIDSVSAWCSRVFKSSLQKFTGLLVDVFDWHELLMENDLLVYVWRLHSHDPSNIFEDDQAEWHVLPEESRVQIKRDLAWISRVLWHHWEGHSAVADVRVEDSLQIRSVRDLALVHHADALVNWQHLAQVQLRELGNESLFDELDLVAQHLDLVGRIVVQVLVQLRHLARLEGSLAIPISEETDDASRVDDLVRWAQGHVQETRDRDRRDEVAVGERVAGVVHLVERERRQIQVLLWPDDVHILPVIHDFTNKWHILQAEEGDFAFQDSFSAA